MRKSLFVLIVLLLIALTGCGNKEPVSTDSDSTTGTLILTPDKDDTTSDETESSAKTERSDETEETSAVEVTKPKETESASTEETQSETVKTLIVSTETEDRPQQNTSSESEVSTTPTENTTSEKTEPTVPKTETAKPTETEAPKEPNATAADANEIAELVVKYINDYRVAQGTSAATHLPGLTEYAGYRSRQIISDFSHNTYDERAAATALSYGMYVDPTLYGMSGEPYYTACSGEAIAKAGYVGTIDHVAKSLADLIRNSSAHWSYVGAADYKYIGVGITYESGMWYCDVALTRENYG